MRITTVLIVCGLGLAACDRIPGTEAHRIAQGEQVAASVLIDPSSAQFRKTVLRPGPKAIDKDAEGARWVVCGEINGKNRNGAYVGFSRFVSDPDGEDAFLEPITDTTEADVQRAADRCARGARGPIYGEADRDLRIMQCEQAEELAQERMAVLEFQAVWGILCEEARPEDNSADIARRGTATP